MPIDDNTMYWLTVLTVQDNMTRMVPEYDDLIANGGKVDNVHVSWPRPIWHRELLWHVAHDLRRQAEESETPVAGFVVSQYDKQSGALLRTQAVNEPDDLRHVF